MSGGGGIKAVYRGTTTGEQIVELPAAVNMNKSFIYSVSKGSAGYVAARGYVSLPEFDIYGWDGYNANTLQKFDLRSDTSGTAITKNSPSASKKISSIRPNGNGSISGGSTDLTVKEYSARLIDETHIQTDGAVEWQLIEYN